MKRTLFFMVCVLASLTMSAQDDLTVGDIQNSGCTALTRGAEDEELVPTIVLMKEGSILSVQLINYEANCCTHDFGVMPDISGGSDGEPCSVSISVAPDNLWDCDCICPFNVSFTVRDLEPDCFYLKCWWYEGMVELTDGEPLVLEYKIENVTIDGISFRLIKVMHKAMLMKWTSDEDDLRIPSEVTYEGESYTVTCIAKDAFWNIENASKITFPKTIRSTDLNMDGIIWANPVRECKSLEWIEVEEGCPLFSSIDGVLFAENKTMLLGYPIASPRETYTVPEGVTKIRSGAFHHNKYLRKLVIPEKVTDLGWHLFSDTKSLEELYIKGVLDPDCMYTLFDGMDTKVVVYVQPSQVDKFKDIYKGPVYPLPEQTIDDVPYRPFVEDGKVWKTGYIFSGNPVKCVEYYYFDGDTIIDGKTCKQMMSQRYVSPGFPTYDIVSQWPSLNYEGAWYEEDKKVYQYISVEKRFQLMYDFSADANDTLQIYKDHPPYIISSKKTGGIKGFKGVYRNVMMTLEGELLDDNISTWLEGVGNIAGPTYCVYLGEELYKDFLMSCTVGDEVIYLNDEYEDGATPDAARKQRIDFTHTIKIKPQSRTTRGAETSLYGEYNEQQLGINLNALDDAYQVSITDEAGKAVYEKTVNAGNIVGLNIDISDYAEGRYIVTVENSNESFTAQFDTHTTEIVEVRRKREEGSDCIYNLQGQRLTQQPRKGVYIRDGRKIVVK